MAGGITTIGGSLGGARQLAAPGAAVARLGEGSWQPLAVEIGLWLFIPPASARGEVWMIGTHSEVGQGATVYCGPSGIYEVRERAWVPVPAGTTSVLVVGSSAPPGPTGQFRYTLERNGVETDAVIVLTGDATEGDTEVAVAYAKGDRLDLRIEALGDAPRAIHNWSVQW